MSEWGAIEFVAGGVLTAIAILTAFGKWRKNDRVRIEKETTILNKIEANWNTTDEHTDALKEHREALQRVTDALEAITNSLKIMQNQRSYNVEREVLKYQAVKLLLEHHKDEILESEAYINKFKEMDTYDYINKQKGDHHETILGTIKKKTGK